MEKIERFLEFAESLKLVRNDHIEIDGKSAIDDIYTDLLPNNGVINKVNLPRTTILIGRKGTGKSTIFQKSQKEVDRSRKNLSIYIDVKSLYDSSSPTLPEDIQKGAESKELKKYLIYSNLIREIIVKTKSKLSKRVNRNYVVDFLGLNEILLDEVFFQLDEIEKNIDSVFKKFNSNLITYFKTTINAKNENERNASLSVSESGITGTIGGSKGDCHDVKKEFDDTLITYLDIKRCFIDNIIKIREILKIKTLYIYLDDFSEIDKQAQILFMDWFVAPINNMSDDFVKFKIAIYPKRFYYGKLDNAKIDEISLDFFDAYYSIEKKNNLVDISRMEHLALDYTERLINSRLSVFFPNNNWERYFDFSAKELYELLFISTMNIPRKMGYILSFCYESCLIHGTKITFSAIENAALRYYTEVVEKYFLVNEYICKPFEDKISNEHQYELLYKIVEREGGNKKFLSRRKIRDTSHFYVNNEMSYLLDNLELNGFLSTYNKIKDKNNIFSTVYSLDNGLCKKYELIFGKPCNPKANSHILPPLFNFNNLIMDYFNSTQVIRCENGHEFPYSEINEFKKFEMNCPTCIRNRKFSKCCITMKFGELKDKFLEQESKERIQITFREYLVLSSLKSSQTSLSFDRLSSFLDYSVSSVGQLVEKLCEKGWVEMDVVKGALLKKEHVLITSKGVRLINKVEKLVIEKVK